MSAGHRPCPICASAERRAHQGHPDVACAGCGALERHRALAAWLKAEPSPRRGARALEIAPFNGNAFGAHLRELGWTYASVHAWRRRAASDLPAGDFVDQDAEASDLPFASSGAYELIVAQRALERSVDYVGALDELARVCQPGGRVVLELLPGPIRVASERVSYAPYGVTWSFGADLFDALDARFPAVERVVIADGDWTGEALVCRAAL